MSQVQSFYDMRNDVIFSDVTPATNLSIATGVASYACYAQYNLQSTCTRTPNQKLKPMESHHFVSRTQTSWERSKDTLHSELVDGRISGIGRDGTGVKLMQDVECALTVLNSWIRRQCRHLERSSELWWEYAESRIQFFEDCISGFLQFLIMGKL